MATGDFRLLKMLEDARKLKIIEDMEKAGKPFAAFLASQESTLEGLICDDIKEVRPVSRKYLPTFAELVDRLSIVQLKEVFIPEHKEEYAKEIKDIMHDIDVILKENNINVSSETIRAIVIVSQYNLHIWHNETNYRKGIKDGNNLELTHSLNGVRNRAKNVIQEVIGGRKDYKIDCLAADHSSWEPSWSDTKKVSSPKI
jgi:hypothetical protein